MNAFRTGYGRALLAAKRTMKVFPADDAIAEIDERDAAVRALARLSPRQRAAVVLTDMLGFRSEEAARMLGIRASTLRMHASRAHATLKETMPHADYRSVLERAGSNAPQPDLQVERVLRRRDRKRAQPAHPCGRRRRPIALAVGSLDVIVAPIRDVGPLPADLPASPGPRGGVGRPRVRPRRRHLRRRSGRIERGQDRRRRPPTQRCAGVVAYSARGPVLVA